LPDFRPAFAARSPWSSWRIFFQHFIHDLPDGPDAIDGLELAQKAVELCPSLRVIYTTGHGPTDGMTALFVEDAAFLPKPYMIKQLTEAVLAIAQEPAR
jgi:DNA-binding NtrC family response regulator